MGGAFDKKYFYLGELGQSLPS